MPNNKPQDNNQNQKNESHVEYSEHDSNRNISIEELKNRNDNFVSERRPSDTDNDNKPQR